MKVRRKDNHEITGEASRFNTHGLGEIIVGFDDGDQDSQYIRDYEVLLSSGAWMDLNEAFRTKTVITDNYNTWFAEPTTAVEKERGYFL